MLDYFALFAFKIKIYSLSFFSNDPICMFVFSTV